MSTSPINTGAAPAQTISGIRLLKEGGKFLIEASTTPAKLPPLILGEQINARVADRLDNGQLLVLIKNGLFTLNMPQGMQVNGDTLSLKVAGLQPSVTFALQEFSQDDTPPQNPSVEVKLSPSSLYLSKLLNQDAPNLASHKEVQLNVAEHPPAEAASQLKKGVETSGLFYESHLKEWANGRLPMEHVLSEPQAKLTAAMPDDQIKMTVSPKNDMPELGNLVQRQLNTLENQQVQLQGMAWPGQPMQVTIRQEESSDRQSSAGQDDIPIWSTSLSMRLPALGGLSARVQLVGNAVQIAFSTEESDTSELIQQHRARLEDGMAAAGLMLAGVSVKNEEASS